MSKPHIETSIIIPAYEREGMTENCVKSVLTSIGTRDDVEVLVIDDCSPVPIALAEIQDSRVHLHRTPENLRFSGTCNFGASMSSAEFLIFLNNDTTTRPGWLENMTSTARSSTDVGVVGARLLYRDGTIQHAGVAFSQRDGVPRHIYRGFPGDHRVVTRSRDFQAVTAACMLTRRAVFEDVGGFDPIYVNGYEDIDLCLKIRQRGYRVNYCGSAVLEHLESVSRRGEVDGLDPAHDANLRLFLERWSTSAVRDELNVYADDELLWVDSGEIYPLVMRCSEELAVARDISDSASIARMLNVRSHQVFDLEKEIGYLTARLLDHGIEP
jgi:GT2 family glycosyltransferase